MGCITYIFFSSQFMFLPVLNFKSWLLIITFYPILSALPQEIIYRSFFFNRYFHLFNSKKNVILFIPLRIERDDRRENSGPKS